MKQRFQSTFARLWFGPLAIAIASAAALYLALIHDGFVDVVSGTVLIIVGFIGLSLLKRSRVGPARLKGRTSATL